VFVSELVRYGSYSDGLTVLSLSSIIQKLIKTCWACWPIVIHPGEALPLTQLVTGRGVVTVLPVNVLWSVAGVVSEIADVVKLNHFVPLVEQSVVPDVLSVVADVDGDHAQPDVSCKADDATVVDRPVSTIRHPLDGDFLSTILIIV